MTAQIVCDYCCLKSDLDDEKNLVQVTRDIQTGYLFGDVVPRKGLAHCHGAEVMIEDIARLGHDRVVLKGDIEPPIRSLQE